MMRTAMTLGLALLLAGCAGNSAPLATPEQDAAGKQFVSPATGLAALYVFRETGGGPDFTVTSEGRTLGRLGGHQWLRVELAPGTHAVHCTASKYSDLVSTTYVNLLPDTIHYASATLWESGFSCRLIVEDRDFMGSITRGTRVQELP